MKERPILFSAPMVRALLNGSKTQTRRIFKAKNGGLHPNRNDLPGMAQLLRNCPYGRPGDKLWVRETFARVDGQTIPWIETDYRATYEHGDRLGDSLGIPRKWKPAIHMPRHACRITLELTVIRLQRIQDISDADLAHEGIQEVIDAGVNHDGTPRDAYRELWQSLNGPASWTENPWVWVWLLNLTSCRSSFNLQRAADRLGRDRSAGASGVCPGSIAINYRRLTRQRAAVLHQRCVPPPDASGARGEPGFRCPSTLDFPTQPRNALQAMRTPPKTSQTQITGADSHEGVERLVDALPFPTFFLSVIAACFGMAGALLLAMPAKPGWGFGAFVVSNLAWLIVSAIKRQWPMHVQQWLFLACSLIGLWNWWLGPLLLG